MKEMQAIDIARRMAELGQTREACQAYTLTIARTQEPEVLFEAALYILENDGNYQVSYDVLLKLYENPVFQQDAFAILTEAFYLPNEKQLKTRYEKNCKLLKKYPYLFKKDFPRFEELPIRFYPFDDNLYVPFRVKEEQFQEKVNFNYQKITHYFFKDLENPILAHDIYSQYELEYLRDNVRPSEYVARDNHVYLHYTSWEIFCAHLQVLNFRELLESKKFVFLMAEEISRYPIDFHKEFGIDYSQYPVEPYHLEEFHKLIWHTQLASHNGGDFFNEIFDNHPNLIMRHSVTFEDIENEIELIRDSLDDLSKIDLGVYDSEEYRVKQPIFGKMTPASLRQEHNQFVMWMLWHARTLNLDLNSRIVPAIFLQPHFCSLEYQLETNDQNRAVMVSKELDSLQNSPLFKQFRYIKTFTPMRRPTNSVAATTRFQLKNLNTDRKEDEPLTVVTDNFLIRILNRSYMVDWQNRLFKDSVLVRFEDGKLNPKATFTALAEFMDIPYTESMTYCSSNGVANVETYPGNAIGFSTKSVYQTYDEFLGTPERYLMEYFMQDTYRRYGYSFQYYDEETINSDNLKKILHSIEITDDLMWRTYRAACIELAEKHYKQNPDFPLSIMDVCVPSTDSVDVLKDTFLRNLDEHRLNILNNLLGKIYYINKNGQPLNFMPLLKLDPELLEQPLYH